MFSLSMETGWQPGKPVLPAHTASEVADDRQRAPHTTSDHDAYDRSLSHNINFFPITTFPSKVGSIS